MRWAIGMFCSARARSASGRRPIASWYRQWKPGMLAGCQRSWRHHDHPPGSVKGGHVGSEVCYLGPRVRADVRAEHLPGVAGQDRYDIRTASSIGYTKAVLQFV